MEGFQIEKMELADLQLLQYVGRATYEPYYPHIWREGGLEWYMDHCFGTAVLQAELDDPNTEYLLARDPEGQIVGLLKLVLLKPAPEGRAGNALYLEKIYLMPDFFGKGAGQKLIGFVLEKAAALGRDAVWLMVMEHGPVNAYLKAGFEKTGSVRWDFEHLREEERNGWVMIRKV